MIINPILGIDTWSGQLEIDEDILKANNVSYMFVRLNDMNGGHHKDTGFDKQWYEARNFYRAPYFVYNPWVTGQENFDWLDTNMPPDAKAVAVDIEVYRAGYSSTTYATEVKRFIDLVRAKWNFVIYTGEWFLSYLANWEINADYWWAQYPYEFYSAPTLPKTWDDLRTQISRYSGPSNYDKIPGRLKFWQFSGDRLILPGNTHEMDVNVFLGTLEELDSFFGGGTNTASLSPAKYQGVKHYEGTAHGWKYFLQIIDPTLVNRYEVVNLSPRETVSSIAKRKGAQIATNASDWNKLTGVLKDPSFAPVLMFGRTLKIDHIDTNKQQPYITGLRYLIRDGVVQRYLYDPADSLYEYASATEGHSRTIEALTSDGKHIQMISEGEYPNKGLTLFQCSEIIKSFGGDTAFDAGGGGDSELWMGGKVINSTENIVNGVHVERALPQVLLIYTGEIMTTRYTAKAIYSTKLRPNHNTVQDFNPVKSISANTIVGGDLLWIADSSNKDVSQYVGDKWLQLATGEWIAIIHRGAGICTLVDNGVVTPPPTTPSVFISHTFKDTMTYNGVTYAATFTVPNVEYKPQA